MTDIIALFPGQGSQKVGMGHTLFEKYELARKIFAEADESLGFSLSEICFSGPEERLTMTEISQPAILTVSTICFALAQSLHPTKFNVKGTAGHSLGEYSSLVAAGALSFKDAVRLVNKRGKYMQEAVPVGVGKMVAVLGKSVEEIEAALSQVSSGVAQIANINSPGQVVVAGEIAAVDEFVRIIAGKVAELSVSAPFHCSLMKPAAEKLKADLDQVQINPAKFPVFSNVTSEATTDPNTIRKNLYEQVCGRVRWVECVQNALATTGTNTAYEFGFGSVLTGMMKRIAPEATRVSISDPEQCP